MKYFLKEFLLFKIFLVSISFVIRADRGFVKFRFKTVNGAQVLIFIANNNQKNKILRDATTN